MITQDDMHLQISTRKMQMAQTSQSQWTQWFELSNTHEISLKLQETDIAVSEYNDF